MATQFMTSSLAGFGLVAMAYYSISSEMRKEAESISFSLAQTSHLINNPPTPSSILLNTTIPASERYDLLPLSAHIKARWNEDLESLVKGLIKGF
ncbi:hypothetical protein [Phaffia rhodozyma]|uniref:Found in mitochondrial proteome protein 51 n=1 Tax=Phaffia rhodozyma TaxID=264483 RepID=A0A0F7SMZ4_PHARH|nr:hypothetical protein [Phaffia rhodozyma]